MAEKQREKKTTQPTAVPPGHFAGALYHDDFGPQIAYASWRWLPIPCPRPGSEGGKSRPLDHVRQIPFVLTPLFDLRFSHIFIWKCSDCVFHVVPL